MADGGLQYFEHLLDAEWEPLASNVQGRDNDVPKPKIVIATDENTKRLNLASTDLLFIREGGSQQLTPRSVGWTEEDRETKVTIDLRTSESRGRLEGFRDSNNVKEEYGGLRGEVKRILDTVRKGDKEYNWIDGYEYRPLSEEVGYANWRGAWEVKLTELAADINQ
jgi:hypothetical protein